MAFSGREERERVTGWLSAAEMQVESLVGACKVESDVAGRGFGVIVADGALLKSGYLASLRRHDARVPVVAVVDAGNEDDAAFKRGVSVIARPLDAASLTLAVSLAHGEGRQARGKVRKRTPRLPSRVSGAPAAIVDISADGLRLELPRACAARLGPQFRLQVPMVALDIVVKRAWVAAANGDSVQCGAMLMDLDHAQRLAWERLMELSASTMSLAGMSDLGREASLVAGGVHLLGRVSQLWASAARVGGWAGHLTRER